MDDEYVPTFATIFLIVWKVFWAVALLAFLVGGIALLIAQFIDR